MRLYAYPTMLYLGLVSGVTAGSFVAAGVGLDSSRVVIAAVLLVIPALVGSRLLFVALNWEVYRRDVPRIWRRSEGGAALYGGLLLALILSVPLLWALSVPLGAFWDVGAITILVGMVFTKIGCLLNGCCAGRPTQGVLGLYLPDDRGVWRRRIPAQLLEAGLAGLLLAVIAVVWTSRPFDGAVFLMAVAAYGGARAGLEPMREVIDRIGSIRVHQAISIVLVILSLTGLWVLWPHA